MAEDWIVQLAGSPWALAALFGLVLADAFLVVLPGEVAVTALGTLASHHGDPALAAVVGVAAVAAFAGDVGCYLTGRLLHPDRWRLLVAHPRLQRASGWAAHRLRTRAATALFTARFIPFMRLAVNLTAGASRVPPLRYLPVAAASAGLWAAYQALIGATIAAVVPGGTLVAVLLSVAAAVLLGWLTDQLVARLTGRGHEPEPFTTSSETRGAAYAVGRDDDRS